MMRNFILTHKPMHAIYAGIITLHHSTNGSDFGENVRVDAPELLWVTDSHEYWRTLQGVFRRSINYWIGSPYGWERVLPCHLNRWGMQDAR